MPFIPTSVGSPEKSPGNSAPSFWSYGRQLVDYSGVLSRSKYQASCSSPQTQAIQGNDIDDGVITYQAQQVIRLHIIYNIRVTYFTNFFL